MDYESLINGRMYCYWSKSIYETKCSLKFCRLIKFNNTHATVDRLDLSVNKRQIVEIKRLKEVRKINKQESLPLEGKA